MTLQPVPFEVRHELSGWDPLWLRLPLLADLQGPFSRPITDSEEVRVTKETDRAWLVVYLPHGRIDPLDARERLDELLCKAPVAAVELAGVSNS